jgi:hypothetical protein
MDVGVWVGGGWQGVAGVGTAVMILGVAGKYGCRGVGGCREDAIFVLGGVRIRRAGMDTARK